MPHYSGQLSRYLTQKPAQGSKPLKILTHVTMLMLVAQLVMGAFVAGLKAGFIFNSWPLMGETFVPDGLLALSPLWRNFADNAVTVQFDHRIGAYILTTLVLILGWFGRALESRLRVATYVLLIAVVAQVILGIVTLVYEVPVLWGTAHQGGGALVLMATVYLMHIQRKGEAL